MEGDEEGVKIGGRVVTNLRYEDDTTILASTEAELKDRLRRIKFQSEKAGLHLNLGKTKVMNTAGVRVFTLGNDYTSIEIVRSFKFLGAVITDDSLCESQIKQRLAMGRSAMQRTREDLENKNIKLDTKTKLVKTLVFPVALYGCETWVMKKRGRGKEIDAFELWCWRRMLELSWRERKTNSWVLQQVKPERSLESKVILASLRYVGHILRSSKSIEKDILAGIVERISKTRTPQN